MTFTVNTKPLVDGLNLSIINQNVSKFYRKSCLAQVRADKTTLTINLEAAFILSEIKLRGSGDTDAEVSVFVDSLLFKQLLNTIESSVVKLEFAEGGLIIHSGKSKFTLPKMVDGDELELRSPKLPQSSHWAVDIDKSEWKFIKDHQMYAIAMSFIHPVYTRVWVSESGDVLVGDFDNSLFTHSVKSNFGDTCLLSDTIINLFTSLPEGAKLIKNDRKYIIHAKLDTFEYISEFTPQYESDSDVGSYNADIILSMMEKDPEGSVHANVSAINKFLSQATLLSGTSDDVIELSVNANVLSLCDKNIDCKVELKDTSKYDYSITFKTNLLKSVLANYCSDQLTIRPMIQDNQVVGIIVWDDDVTTVLAGVEE